MGVLNKYQEIEVEKILLAHAKGELYADLAKDRLERNGIDADQADALLRTSHMMLKKKKKRRKR